MGNSKVPHVHTLESPLPLIGGDATQGPPSVLPKGTTLYVDDAVEPAEPCATVDPEKRMTIREGANGAVGVCRVDGLGDCGYSRIVGNTFVYSRPDLNSDGHDDYLIEDYTGLHGIPHDVMRFMGFVGCADGAYVQVLDDVLTDIPRVDAAPARKWSKLRVTRACFDASLGDVVTREYTVAFDQTRSFYGPPDGDPELADYCTDKEQPLPMEGDDGE